MLKHLFQAPVEPAPLILSVGVRDLSDQRLPCLPQGFSPVVARQTVWTSVFARRRERPCNLGLLTDAEDKFDDFMVPENSTPRSQKVLNASWRGSMIGMPTISSTKM